MERKQTKGKSQEKFSLIKASQHLVKNGGFSRRQADTQLEVMDQMIHDDLCTKADLQASHKELKHEIELVRLEFKRDVESLHRSLVRELGSLIIACFTILGVVLKIL